MSPKAQPRRERPPQPAEPAKRDDARREREAPEDVDEQLDQELEDSFPASDPPSLTQDQK